jgi:hypothetical protein
MFRSQPELLKLFCPPGGDETCNLITFRRGGIAEEPAGIGLRSILFPEVGILVCTKKDLRRLATSPLRADAAAFILSCILPFCIAARKPPSFSVLRKSDQASLAIIAVSSSI